jgi:hypothetical protein
MAHSFKRLELYNLVWSEPMRDIAARFEISDVGLAKACRNASIPVPPRGYWNKKKAGHRVAHFPLPAREPGHSDEVTIGQDRYWSYHEPIGENEPEPAAPVFEESIESVRARVDKRTSAVRVSTSFELAHPDIRKLLDKDERKREKQRNTTYAWAWDTPIFDSPLHRRRLRILNALLLALAKQGFSGSVRGDKADEITIRIGRTSFELELAEVPRNPRTAGQDETRQRRESLRLAIKAGYKTAAIPLTEDQPGRALEMSLRTTLVNLIVLGEGRYREHQIDHHKWLLQRRLERIEEARKQKAEAKRKERERIAALEKARLDRLLDEAQALQRARDIRSYVDEVKALNLSLDPPVPDAALAEWAQWALAQANRIDPVQSRRFLNNDELKSSHTKTENP